VLLAYRENTTRFHRRISRGETARMLLGVMVVLGAVILLGSINPL
jgi:hypothetical protein